MNPGRLEINELRTNNILEKFTKKSGQIKDKWRQKEKEKQRRKTFPST